MRRRTRRRTDALAQTVALLGQQLGWLIDIYFRVLNRKDTRPRYLTRVVARLSRDKSLAC